MVKIVPRISIKLDIKKPRLLKFFDFLEINLDNEYCVYLLGIYHIQINTFKVYYIGRTENLSQRIKEHIGEEKEYQYYMYKICKNKIEAFENECILYHNLEVADCLKYNKIHPSKLDSYQCPICDIFE